jgi:predicted ArsR family transcriptional regulator
MDHTMARRVSVTDDEILEQFEMVDAPVRTAPEMAQELPIGQDGLRRRLKELEGEGRVVSRQVGARSVVWWKASIEASAAPES